MDTGFLLQDLEENQRKPNFNMQFQLTPTNLKKIIDSMDAEYEKIY